MARSDLVISWCILAVSIFVGYYFSLFLGGMLATPAMWYRDTCNEIKFRRSRSSSMVVKILFIWIFGVFLYVMYKVFSSDSFGGYFMEREDVVLMMLPIIVVFIIEECVFFKSLSSGGCRVRRYGRWFI